MTNKQNISAKSAAPRLIGNAILAAALTMPCLQSAQAESAPERGLISYKYLNYQDSQPSEDRIGVEAHSLLVMVPFAEKWSIQGSVTVDTISGASPQLWTVTGASMRDKRNAEDVSLTRYFDHDTVTVAATLSEENDYTARGFSVTGTHSSEDKNTTFNYGIGASNDHITSQGVNENKHLVDVMLGVTQVMTRKDIAQLTLTHTEGRGFYTDPYKISDVRPREKQQSTALARWNHFIEGSDATLRLSYRYYTDSWSVHAHTFGVEYVQPLSKGWTLTPLLRLHDESAADFYVDPANFPGLGVYHSQDQRLSAYGALSVGFKVAKEIDENWTADMKYEHYEQRGSWRLLGDGSPGLAPFRAHIFQLGLSRKF
jgi:hypothetical protein